MIIKVRIKQLLFTFNSRNERRIMKDFGYIGRPPIVEFVNNSLATGICFLIPFKILIVVVRYPGENCLNVRRGTL